MKEIAQYRFCSETGFKEASQPEMIIIALDQTQSLAHRKILVDRAGNPINRFDCPLYSYVGAAWNYSKTNRPSIQVPSFVVPFDQTLVLCPYGFPFLYSPTYLLPSARL